MYFDIQSSNKTIKKLFNYFDINAKNFPDLQDYYKLGEKLKDIIKKYHTENICENNFLKSSITDFKNLCLGDFIEIEYTPPSIKHLNDYPKLYGIVIYIDNDNNDGLIYSNDNFHEQIQSISRKYCGYGSNTSHLHMFHITRYEKNNLV